MMSDSISFGSLDQGLIEELPILEKDSGSRIDPELTEETTKLEEAPFPILSIRDRVLNDSRLTPNGNGSLETKELYAQRPTEGQKWWAAVIFGFVFGLVASPALYHVTSKITTTAGYNPTMSGPGPSTFGLFLHSIIFILMIRLILW